MRSSIAAFARRPRSAISSAKSSSRSSSVSEEARREEEARLRTEQLAREKRHRARVLDSAAAQLKAYGFTDNEAIAEVLAKHGPGDLKSCVRSLVELNRTRAAARKAAFSSETESASTSPAASSSSEPDEEPMSQAEAASVVQGLVRGRSTRKDALAVRNAAEKTAQIEAQAAAEEANWEGEQDILRQEHRELKMVNGVPYGMIAYEEALLRLQMKLDDISAGAGVSNEARAMVRQLRKAAVVNIQSRLERIDAARAWWQASPKDVAADMTVPTQPVSVA